MEHQVWSTLFQKQKETLCLWNTESDVHLYDKHLVQIVLYKLSSIIIWMFHQNEINLQKSINYNTFKKQIPIVGFSRMQVVI